MNTILEFSRATTHNVTVWQYEFWGRDFWRDKYELARCGKVPYLTLTQRMPCAINTTKGFRHLSQDLHLVTWAQGPWGSLWFCKDSIAETLWFKRRVGALTVLILWKILLEKFQFLLRSPPLVRDDICWNYVLIWHSACSVMVTHLTQDTEKNPLDTEQMTPPLL
jgi:hypothetical protein